MDHAPPAWNAPFFLSSDFLHQFLLANITPMPMFGLWWIDLESRAGRGFCSTIYGAHAHTHTHMGESSWVIVLACFGRNWAKKKHDPTTCPFRDPKLLLSSTISCCVLFFGVAKNGGFPKKWGYQGFFSMKNWMIWGYHHLWKHPEKVQWSSKRENQLPSVTQSDSRDEVVVKTRVDLPIFHHMKSPCWVFSLSLSMYIYI